MKLALPLLTVVCLFNFVAFAGVPSAEEVISQAKSKAATEQKALFVHFGASWCGWCKRLDSFLDREDIKPVFEKYFIPVKLVVQENDKNKSLENPGAEVLLKKLGGPSGLPYSAFLDAKGDSIINSKLHGENIGYPAQPEEIGHFIQMMKQASPKMPESDLKIIETALRSFKRS